MNRINWKNAVASMKKENIQFVCKQHTNAISQYDIVL